MGEITFDKNKVYFRLSAFEYCRKHPEIVSVPFQGMAVTFHHLLEQTEEKVSSFAIRKEMIDRWGINETELFYLGSKNTPELFPEMIFPLEHLVVEQVLDDHENVDPSILRWLLEGSYTQAWVSTNRNLVLGAASILYPGHLKWLSDLAGGDIYIIPSSIHEMIIYPAGDDIEREDLDQLLQTINHLSVPEEEVLSDHVLYYKRAEARFE